MKLQEKFTITPQVGYTLHHTNTNDCTETNLSSTRQAADRNKTYQKPKTVKPATTTAADENMVLHNHNNRVLQTTQQQKREEQGPVQGQRPSHPTICHEKWAIQETQNYCTCMPPPPFKKKDK